MTMARPYLAPRSRANAPAPLLLLDESPESPSPKLLKLLPVELDVAEAVVALEVVVVLTRVGF